MSWQGGDWGPRGITVEQVQYTDKAGHRRRVLRVRHHGVFRGDYSSVEALAEVIEVGELAAENDLGLRADSSVWEGAARRAGQVSGG